MILLLLGLAWRPDGSDGLDPDEELVRRFQGGDKAAFSDILQRYQDRVYTLSLRWMGEQEVAEEVAQDVFVALFRSLDRFRGESRLSTWIFRVTVNHCKNRRLYRRRRKVDQHEPLEGLRPDDDAPVRQLPDDGPGTDTRVHRSEAGRLLQDALERLDESHRTILVLRDVEDLPYEEIAEILDLPRGTVKSRLHRARAELARVLSRVIGPEDIFE